MLVVDFLPMILNLKLTKQLWLLAPLAPFKQQSVATDRLRDCGVNLYFFFKKIVKFFIYNKGDTIAGDFNR